MKQREDLDPPEGMQRVTIDSSSSNRSRNTIVDPRSKNSGGSEEKETSPSVAIDDSRTTSSGGSGSNSDSETDPASETTDPVTRMVEELKGLSYEERGKRINKAPSFLRNRVRQKLEEARK